MSATVDALLPLSLLEAVRNVDTPDDFEAEFVPELLNKRLGMSETVYAQIKRYTDAKKRNQRTEQEEAIALARLIGRRPDAEAVFRAAGRLLAREAYLTIAPATRRMLLALPGLVARPMALQQLRRIAGRYLNGDVRRVGPFLLLDVPDSTTADSAPRDAGCTFYESSLRELLRLLSVGGSGVEHTRCVNRGDDSCEWRAEWSAVERRPA